ncbi:MAG TPA: 3-hydroxybutyrate oligomer hydrolase family protein [Myxococcaceae bacterium]|nr:3-hydroxybutyrate oligomer hydrolase family protein [Myxococcaceae bacterium]
MRRASWTALALSLTLFTGSAFAGSRCDALVARFGPALADVTCFESPDLTTNNVSAPPTGPTTPANDSITTLPPFAFTPITDRAVISPNPPNRTPITKAVPGVQLEARIADDPTGEARFLLRLPDDWNGRLVVAGASGTRSEFNGDFAWSDYVVQKGYAYASQNKGVLNLTLVAVSATPPADPLACRLNPTSTVWVHFYDNDPGQPFTRWREFIIEGAQLARHGVKAHYGRHPRYTYAVGTSNGGYQVRRAIETAPDLFDGGIDWEGTFVDSVAQNLLTDLPPGILNYPDYVASGFDPNSTAAKNIRAAGYPPDLVTGTTSLWGLYYGQFWEVTQCQWQKRLDPSYDTYGSGTGTYNYVDRLSFSDVGANMAAFATSGRIQRPLITVAGTMDALLPIDHHARAYARKVAHASKHEGHDGWRDGCDYRLYEVQNGNHIETYKDTFPQLEFIQPHAQQAFDLLVAHVEQGRALPPDQCIPKGGTVTDPPAQPGHCSSLYAP